MHWLPEENLAVKRQADTNAWEQMQPAHAGTQDAGDINSSCLDRPQRSTAEQSHLMRAARQHAAHTSLLDFASDAARSRQLAAHSNFHNHGR